MGALESALLRPQMGYYDGLIEEAAAFHLERMAEDEEAFPDPSSIAIEVEVEAPVPATAPELAAGSRR